MHISSFSLLLFLLLLISAEHFRDRACCHSLSGVTLYSHCGHAAVRAQTEPRSVMHPNRGFEKAPACPLIQPSGQKLKEYSNKRLTCVEPFETPGTASTCHSCPHYLTQRKLQVQLRQHICNYPAFPGFI